MEKQKNNVGWWVFGFIIFVNILDKTEFAFLIPFLFIGGILFFIFKSKKGIFSGFQNKILKEVNSYLGTDYTKISQVSKDEWTRFGKYKNGMNKNDKVHTNSKIEKQTGITQEFFGDLYTKQDNKVSNQYEKDYQKRTKSNKSIIFKENIYKVDKSETYKADKTNKNNKFSNTKTGSIWDNRKSVLDEFKK